MINKSIDLHKNVKNKSIKLLKFKNIYDKIQTEKRKNKGEKTCI